METLTRDKAMLLMWDTRRQITEEAKMSSRHVLFKDACDFIFKCIKNAISNGAAGVDVLEKDIKARLKPPAKMVDIHGILRDLGYKIDYSLSSDPDNERLFIKWSQE